MNIMNIRRNVFTGAKGTKGKLRSARPSLRSNEEMDLPAGGARSGRPGSLRRCDQVLLAVQHSVLEHGVLEHSVMEHRDWVLAVQGRGGAGAEPEERSSRGAG